MPVSQSRPRPARLISCLLVAVTLLVSVMPSYAQTPSTSAQTTSEGTPFVRVEKGSLSVPTDGAFALSVRIAVDVPTTYLESRVQIFNPGGRLLYQKTEIRHEVTTGTVAIGYQRDLADLGLSPGVYPIEVRVRSDSTAGVREWLVEDRLLIYAPDPSAVPVALVVRVSAAPAYDPEGRFVVDPTRFDAARQQVDELARWVLDDPALRISLALPPMLAEEWSRIAAGYETAGPEGVGEVTADEEVPRRYATTLERLGAALATNRLELMTVGYSDPDMAGLSASRRVSDLAAQYARGYSATLAAIETSPTGGASFADDVVVSSALDQIAARDLGYFLVSPSSLVASETTPPAGLYETSTITESGVPLYALVVDPLVSDSLDAQETSTVVDAVFERAISTESTAPLTAVLTVGPGRTGSVIALRDQLAELIDAPWTQFATTGEVAAGHASSEVTVVDAPVVASAAPSGYWSETGEARRLAVGLTEAAGTNDPDAQAAADASLIAQSSAWAGPDETWAIADRGLGFAAAASREAETVFGALTLSAQDITLSSTQGDVPVNVTNDSGKTLSLKLNASARGIALPERPDSVLTIMPQDNFLTVPVDLQSSLSGDLELELYAGNVMIDSTTVTVRASFLDRLAIVGLVAVVLVALLLYIRRRARRADSAGNMKGSGHEA